MFFAIGSWYAMKASMYHSIREVRKYAELAEFFDTAKTERFFIKNLERVQADERDVIMLSLGYGKDSRGDLPLSFGPIVSASGRRRLNVAITRSKERMVVVASFQSCAKSGLSLSMSALAC